MKDLVELNPHLNEDDEDPVETLMSWVNFEEDGYTLKNWDLNSQGLTALPESIGDLTFTGDLTLTWNQLTTLPESFGSLTVGGDLDLYENPLTTLPETFPNVKGYAFYHRDDYYGYY